MNLQKKSLIIFLAVLITVLIFISTVISSIFLASYSSLEERYVSNDVRQTVDRLNNEEGALSGIVSDWGPWDDTYNFVKGGNPGYIETNLLPETYDTLSVNLVIITNRDGKVVYSGMYDAHNKTLGPVPAPLLSGFHPGNPLLNMSDSEGTTSGILLLQDSSLIIASRPIVHTNFSGTPEGVVIMGRYLDDTEIARLAALPQSNLEFRRVTDPGLDPALLRSLRSDPDATPVVTRVVDKNTISGYSVIRDLYGNDALVLSFTQPRDIYQQGVTTTVMFIWIILFSGLILGIVSILLLDRFVLSRVSTLSMQVNRIGTGGLSGRIELTGNDEIGGLAVAINRMLADLENYQQEQKKSETRFRELADLLPLAVFEIDLDANLTYLNKHGKELFLLTEKDLSEGLNVRQIMTPEDVSRMSRNLEKIVAGEKPVGHPYAVRKKDNTILQAILFTSPIHHEGRLEGFRGSGIDISDRIRLEEALTESGEYLQTLIWSIRVGIIVVDVETHTIIDINPAALEMIGATKESIINQQCHKVICPSDEGRCPITDMNQSVDNAERFLLTRDGREIPIIKYVVPVMLHGRSCLLETFIDNTYRKRIELKLAESEEKYRSLAENSADVLFSLDMAGVFTYISPQVNKYGFLESEIVGKSFRDIIHPDDIDRVEHQLSSDLEKGAQFNSAFRILDKWGHVHWFDEKSTLRLDQSGKPLGIYGVLRDDSERKRTEEALIELKNQYIAIFDNTGSATIIVARDTSIILANPGWAGLTGIPREDWIGKSWMEVVHPEDLETMKKYHEDRRSNPSQVPREYSFRLIDASKKIHSCLASVVMIPGTTDSIAAVVDISERKRAEDAVELANKKLNLMNNITRHDILNTITGLLGCVDMANAATTPEERTHLLSDIKDLTRVIQRQIVFTREYQEVGVHLPLWQNLNEVMTRVLSNFENSRMHIVTDLENAEIYADPLLEKVFYNLIDNAIRYGETVTTIKFYFQISDRGLFIICEDDGAGILPEDKMRIFERGVGRNTGMGLFLTREILTITGITIVENGVYGKGARFVIHNPRGTFRFVRQ